MQVNWHNVYKALSSAWHLVSTLLVTVLLKERRHGLKQVDWQRGLEKSEGGDHGAIQPKDHSLTDRLPKASGLAGRVRCVRAGE